MPKNAYKPSNSLSQVSKKRREKIVEINYLVRDLVNNTDNVISPVISIPSQQVEPPEQFSQIDSSYNILPGVIDHYSNNEPEPLAELCLELGEKNIPQHEPDLNAFDLKLASFITNSRLPRSRASELLKLLKSVDNLGTLKSLPSDSRTLLSTPRSGNVEIKTIVGGQYIHFGISNGLKYLLNTDPYVRQLTVLELWFNINSLPIDRKGKSLWPILCGICVDNSIKPFIIGSYFGEKKPYNVHEYLSTFIHELNGLINNGLQFNNNNISIHLKGLIADAPARAYIKQVKGHSGYFGCEKCMVEGEYLYGSVSFNDETAQERTDDSFLNRTNEEHHVGISPLLDITGIGLVSSIPLDYMHLCCLGIMKKILHCIVRGSNIPNSCGPIRLSKDQIILINNRLKIISKWLCSDFVRVPHNLNDFNTFKATELRQIMLYTGPFLFKHIVSLPVYNSLIMFNIVMRILSCSKTVYSQNDYANALAKHFVKTFSHVFGRGNVSYNVHSFIHLANYCKKYGVVDNFSAFPFENYLQHLKKILQPGPSPLVQLHNRIIEERVCCHTNISEIPLYPLFDGHHYEGPLPENIRAESVTQYSILFMPTYTLRIQKQKRRSTKKDNCVIMSSNVICIVKNIVERNGEIFLVCSTFEKVDPFYNTPCSSTSVGIFECSKISSTVQLFHINSVKFKASYFPFSDKELQWEQNKFYVCSLLHIHN